MYSEYQWGERRCGSYNSGPRVLAVIGKDPCIHLHTKLHLQTTLMTHLIQIYMYMDGGGFYNTKIYL